MRLRTFLLVLAIAANAKSAERGGSPILSLCEGATWTYAGTVKWTPVNSTEVRSARLRWKMWVERISTDGKKTIAIVRGFPFELAWYEPGREPGYAVVVEDGGRVEVESCNSAAEAEETMNRALRGAHIGSELLRSPVRVGDCLAADEDGERTDKRHCWLVERAVREKRGAGWRLVYRTAPDHQILHIVYGTGITRYVFEHHGTVASADVHLESVTAAGRP